MQVVMSNPGLEFAMVGNPGPKRRGRKPQKKGGRKMARRRRSFTKKQAQALAKGFRARGMAVPAKIRAKLRNPGTKAGARKARRKKRIKQLRKRRATAKRYRRKARGYKVVVRRKAGRRKKSRRFSKRTGIRTGRKGTISFRGGRGRRKKLIATNPGGALSFKGWTSGFTDLPKNLPKLLKGKKMVSNVLYMGGGALVSTMAGGLARGAVLGAIGQVAPTIASSRIVQGVVGAATSYTGGYLVAKVLIKNKTSQAAFITGSAAAAIVSAIFPGQINAMLTSIPMIGPQLSMLPGMDGYVSAPSYQGVGSYVEAPGYQGIGLDPSDAVAGIGMDDMLAGGLSSYVEAPGYQGVGMYGESFLDQ